MLSTTTTTSPKSSNNTVWIDGWFQKDTKLRVRERYQRRQFNDQKEDDNDDDDSLLLAKTTTSTTTISSSKMNIIIIPSGIIWRKYLGLFIDFIHYLKKNNNNELFQFILLESAVEYMDWRCSSSSNVSPITTNNNEQQQQPEKCTPRERFHFLKLIKETTTSDDDNLIRVFCDLSLLFDNEESLMMLSQMTTPNRAKYALQRAGRHFFSTESRRVVLLVDDDDDEFDHLDEMTTMLSVEEFLNQFIQSSSLESSSTTTIIDDWHKKRLQCLKDYKRRNKSTTKNNSTNNNNKQQLHFSDSEIQMGLSNSTMIRGRLMITNENVKEAYVRNSTTGISYFVPSNLYNHAFHQDVVIVHILPESEWLRPIGRRRLVHYRDDEEEEDEEDDTTLESSSPVEPTVPTARVIQIVEPSRHVYVATMLANSLSEVGGGNSSSILVVPSNIKIPKIRIAHAKPASYLHQRLLVQVDSWDDDSMYPNGHVIEILGPIGSMETEMKCLLETYNIRLEPWSIDSLSNLPTREWSIPQEEVSSRRDLRYDQRNIFSVDPPGCQDIDDTMHVHILSNGNVEFGVHIADVTYFVPHNSSLDKQAQSRGTTFYMVDRRYDMLPSILSSNLCSLHENVDRLAVSVIWIMTPDLEEMVEEPWMGRTIIHNVASMTYLQAHNILHDLPPNDDKVQVVPPLTAGGQVNPKLISKLKVSLQWLTKFTRKLKKYREDIGGAIDLTSNEVGSELKFVLGGDESNTNNNNNTTPIQVSLKQEMEIHHTIAEMMIHANQTVAKQIHKVFPTSSLLRIHRPVEQYQLKELQNVLLQQQQQNDGSTTKFDASSNKALANTLARATNTTSTDKNKKQDNDEDGTTTKTRIGLYKSLATRAMSEALYICTGTTTAQDQKQGLGHYGLGIQHYTHFTSPIRRYADVVVHKQLLASLEVASSSSTTSVPTMIRPPPGFEETTTTRPELGHVPDSAAISILKGEGLLMSKKVQEEVVERNVVDTDDDNDDKFLETLIDGAEKKLLLRGDDTTTMTSKKDGRKTTTTRIEPYNSQQVDDICQILNQQNRNAKLSSMECQRLFLSLYFRYSNNNRGENNEEAMGVITDIRDNGFMVYVPKYDLKGPVFLMDKNGSIQMDPALLLNGTLALSSSEEEGGLLLPPTGGFKIQNGRNRFLTRAKMEVLRDDNNDKKALKVSYVTAAKDDIGRRYDRTFKMLDVVTVQITCEDSGVVQARIPPPRLHLVASSSSLKKKQEQTQSGKNKLSLDMMPPSAEEEKQALSLGNETDGSRKGGSELEKSNTMYAVLANITIYPVLPPSQQSSRRKKTLLPEKVKTSTQAGDSNKMTSTTSTSTIAGRRIFCSFVNPDTKTAQQEFQQHRHLNITGTTSTIMNPTTTSTTSSSYDASRQMEREATARMQRKAAEKRNARRGKAK